MPVPFRIPIPVLHLESASDRWQARDKRRRAGDNKPPLTNVIVVAVIAGLIGLAAAVFLVRTLRKRNPNPKYIPTPFLKRLWTSWKVPARRSGPRYELSPDDDADWSYTSPGRAPGSQAAVGEIRTARPMGAVRNSRVASASAAAAAAAGDSGVDRNTSVRSVLTLPAYRIQPTDTEQVLGREGERDGIDVVVELPTAEADEAMREEEMDALYQIRMTRRRQVAEREERRRRRREARDRNDRVALQELAPPAPGANTAEVEELRREHERIKATRQRAVSSVSYHDVGIARHDGTRIRANSTESERVGLLSDAASIAASANGTTTTSTNTTATGPSSLLHRRDYSRSSALSIDTAHSFGGEPPGSPGLATAGSHYSLHSQARSRANSGPNTPRLSGITTRRGSIIPDRAGAEEADLGDADMPPHSPPGYDDVSLDDGASANNNNNSNNNNNGNGNGSSGSTIALTPVNSGGSGANSPYNEPPPDYPGWPTRTRNNRLSAHMADLAAGVEEQEQEREREQRGERRGSRGVGGIPQLPSLRLSRLPQIVIEPSSARPGDD